jgi:hypothetical protein
MYFEFELILQYRTNIGHMSDILSVHFEYLALKASVDWFNINQLLRSERFHIYLYVVARG